MKRTWTCLLAVIVAAAFLALPAQAVSAKKETKDSSVKIGVIDMKRLAQESKAAKIAIDTLRKDRDDKIAILSEKLKDLQAMEADLKSSSSRLTAEERRDKADKLGEEGRDLKRLQEDMNIDYKKKELELNQKFNVDIVKVIDDYVKKEGLTVVLNRTGVLSLDPAVDITDDIIKLYDAKK